jgi:hypothetical protein
MPNASHKSRSIRARSSSIRRRFESSFYGTLHLKFKLNLRHLFASLDLAGLVEDAPLPEAVAFLQEILRHGSSPRQMNPSNFPAGMIAKGVQRLMY